MNRLSDRCALCDSDDLELALSYDSPPEGETRFELAPGQHYRRAFMRCRSCGLFASEHELDLSGLYSGDYMEATYGGDRLERTFERIMALPPDRSDNVQRVARVAAHVDGSRTVLDVGSGLGVFPARMKEAGFECTALDPDPRAVQHARERVGVDAVLGDYMTLDGLGRYDLVTFNKVLEHVEDPVAMLARSRSNLNAGGTVYVELPDGEAAVADGPGREEFFIEHLWAFSMPSLCLLAARAGLMVTRAERLREPSGKYTLFAFLG